MKRPILHREYLKALRKVEQYRSQIQDTLLWVSDLIIDQPVKRNYPESQVYWVCEIDGEDVLIRNRYGYDEPGYDDYWVNISELRPIITDK